MFIRYFEEIPLRHEAAEQAFMHQPEALLRRLAGEADHNGEQLEVEVGFMNLGARVRRTVEVIVGEPVQVSGRLLVPIEWKPLHGHHLLPGLQGELEVGGLGPQRTQIALSARYQPPLGLLGSAADRALLHRIAEATVRDFVQRLAQAILVEVFQGMTEEDLLHRHAAAYALTLLRGQEDERRRIAQELHDQPVQSLIHLCRGLDGVRGDETIPMAARTQLLDARHTAEAIIESLRQIARGLRPPALDDLGLEACVRRLVSDLQERTGMAAGLRFPEHLARLTPEIELAIFRIAQEALSNVERHASARSVSVSIDVVDDEIALAVDDDGIGFEHPALINDPTYAPLGLVGMTERAELLGGRLDIVSTPHGGTHLRAVVPLWASGQVKIMAAAGSGLR